MKIGDEVYIHGYVDEIRKDTIIVRNEGGYFGTVETEIRPMEKEPKTDRLYNWLNDMRFGIAPDETTPQDERDERSAQVDVIDDIMEWLEKNRQEPKIGHWIKSHIPNEEYVCSECGGGCWYYDYQAYVARSKYCPNCGAKMESEVQE